jgi:hypothetical protein
MKHNLEISFLYNSEREITFKLPVETIFFRQSEIRTVMKKQNRPDMVNINQKSAVQNKTSYDMNAWVHLHWNLVVLSLPLVVFDCSAFAVDDL